MAAASIALAIFKRVSNPIMRPLCLQHPQVSHQVASPVAAGFLAWAASLEAAAAEAVAVAGKVTLQLRTSWLRCCLEQ